MHLQNLYRKKMQMQIKQYYMHSIVRLWISYMWHCTDFFEDSDTEEAITIVIDWGYQWWKLIAV